VEYVEKTFMVQGGMKSEHVSAFSFSFLLCFLMGAAIERQR